MKTLTFSASLYKTVELMKQFKQLNSAEVQRTKLYDFFKPIEGNRGRTQKFDEKRVRNIVKIIESGNYYEEMSLVIVNKKGTIIDGVHRVEALRRKDMYVYFRMLTSDRYNPKNPADLMLVVSTINTYNPAWTAKEMFETALLLGNKLATLLDDLRCGLVTSNELPLVEGDIRINTMMVLVKRDPKQTHGRRVNFGDYYCEDKYLEYAQSPEFVAEFKYVCKIIAFCKSTEFDAARILEQLLNVMWTDANFNRDIFYANIIVNGFKIAESATNRAKAIRNKILELGYKPLNAKAKKVAKKVAENVVVGNREVVFV
jgi:hypothetical protein